MAEASPFNSPVNGFIGTPDEIAARIEKFVGLGAQHFIFRFVDFPSFAGAQLFIDEVLPRFK